MIWKAKVSGFDEKSEKTFLLRGYSPVKAVNNIPSSHPPVTSNKVNEMGSI
jgi:hypothetical protein